MGCADFGDYMVHRRQAIDLVGLVIQLAGFIVLISLFFPTIRRALAGFSILGVCVSIFIVVCLIGFSVYRLTFRLNNPTTENPFASANDASDPNAKSGETNSGGSSSSDDVGSEAVPDVLEPALRRRYPWRREMADNS